MKLTIDHDNGSTTVIDPITFNGTLDYDERMRPQYHGAFKSIGPPLEYPPSFMNDFERWFAYMLDKVQRTEDG